MNAWLRRPIVVLLSIPVFCGGAAVAHEARERVAIEWKRDPRATAHRTEAAPPVAPDPPPELAVAPEGPTENVEPSRVEPSRAGRPTGGGSIIDDLAVRAGEEMAQEAARVWGWREYWRAGFARGLDAALDDSRLGSWDHEQGLRFGRSDPRVRPLGEHLATEAAGGVADQAAEAQVRQQFMDLAHQPGRDRAGPSRPSRETVPRFDGPFAVAPVFDAVLREYPMGQTPGLSRDGRGAIEDWHLGPAILARRDRASAAYDARWKDPEFAFSRWRERQRRGSLWSRWSASEQDRFHVVFRDRFRAALASIDQRWARVAWRTGFEDGWRYGATIQAEWAYRQGYAEGFDFGVSETAAIAFPYAYERAFASAYARWFEEWSRTAHPGVDAVRLADETGDGVFEPGEVVLVEVDVVNYGGGAGAFDLIASGTDLGAPATMRVALTSRGRVAGTKKLTLRVPDRVPPRTRTAVTVALADARADAPLYVSRPLEFDGTPVVDADRIGGRVTLTLAVQNTSRRDAPAVVSVLPLSGARDPREDDLGTIPAGGRRQASVTFNGIHPLDLIGGTSRWRASVARGGKIDDAREIRIDPVATDLSNPDLMDFMVALAGLPRVSPADVRDARALMIDRLRADWERAAEASGNPYKRDFETGGTETVLGELVRTTTTGRHSFASPQVFDGLDDDVAALIEELPGAHPLLRKWMKKLAKRVG
jgi:hypothetical protein